MIAKVQLTILNYERLYLLNRCKSKEEGKDQEIDKVTKTQENIIHKRAMRSALSQQVTTRLQRTDKTV